MKHSVPVYRLKRRARSLSRENRIPLHQALDLVAVQAGYSSWSLLAARHTRAAPSSRLLTQLDPGDLVLLGARPGQGKTLMGLSLMIEAAKSGQQAAFFTLEFTDQDLSTHLRTLGADPAILQARCLFDTSDAISADYIINRMGSATEGAIVVIDYLQLLDQKRTNPDLASQVGTLKSFANARSVVIVCLSQIDRSFELSARSVPGIEDIRLPNPLDLSLFNKTCFMNNGAVVVG